MHDLIAIIKNGEYAIQDYNGFEALSLGERFKLFTNQASLNIDKAFASIRGSIHQVDYKKAKIYVANRLPSYTAARSVPVVIPSYYSPKVISYSQYIGNLLTMVPIVNMLKTEADKFYAWVKAGVVEGKFSKTFDWSISGTNNLINETEDKIKILQKNVSSKANFGDLYDNFNQLFGHIENYNTIVKFIGARDVEMVSKTLDQVYRVSDMLMEKINVGDINLSEDDLTRFKVKFSDFVRFVDIVGAVIGLVNEQHSVFKAHCEAVLKFK